MDSPVHVLRAAVPAACMLRRTHGSWYVSRCLVSLVWDGLVGRDSLCVRMEEVRVFKM